MNKFLIVIAGPTASGKTGLAISLARFLNTEIISADSRQVFKELNIGVARPAKEQLQQAKHHFIGSVPVQDDFSAGKFEEEALRVLNKIFEEKDTAILVGGTGLYIRAVCNGMDAFPDTDPDIRRQLIAAYKEKGIGFLQEELKKNDPDYYQKVDRKNPQRLMRALEVIQTTGRPFSSFHSRKKKKRDFHILKIGLDPGKEELHQNINERVDAMMQQGLLEEVKRLMKFQSLNALQTVGYKELFYFLEGKTSLDEAVERIKQNTRKYAKRQMTWFRKDKEITWFGPRQEEEIIKYLRAQIPLLA